MDNKFKRKLEYKKLKENINEIHGICFVLSEYCYAYRDKENIEHLLPIINFLEQNTQKLKNDINKIVTSEEKKEKDYFIEKLEQIDWSNYIFED